MLALLNPSLPCILGSVLSQLVELGNSCLEKVFVAPGKAVAGNIAGVLQICPAQVALG